MVGPGHATTTAAPSPGVTVSARALTVNENRSATYALVLDTAPTAAVTVAVATASGDDADLTVSPSSLIFTTADWNTAQTVTVSAADDGDTAAGAATLSHTATSTDSAYNGIAIASVVATEDDDDDSLPGQPTGLVAVPGDGQVALRWDALGESFVTKWQYRIKSPGKANYHAWRDVPDSDADTTTYIVTGGGLTNGQVYHFQVRAVNGAVGGEGRHAGAGPASDAVRATVGELGPEISVADARANEGAGASVAFQVSLDRAFTSSEHSVTVDYATSDGSAKAGEDYTATSGTLTFAAGEKTKTVNVPVLDDAVDEGEETFTFRLSNATGGRIGDGEATGTIANDDPLQKMWLSRFGRTVASHVTDAVSDRLANPPSGAQVTVGGQRVDLAAMQDEARVGEALTAVARALGAPEDREPDGFGSGPGQAGAGGWPQTGLGRVQTVAPGSTPAREITGRELLLGSAFHLAREGDGIGPGLAAWGRVTMGGFDGEAPADDGNLRIDGEVTTGILGADAEWNRLLIGVAISVSEGEGTFAQPGVDKGTIESTMTTVSPYARLAVTERVSVWGLAGWGTGDRGRGLSFSLAPTYGAASSDVGRLWSARDAQGLAPGGEFEPERRLEGELGYGMSVLGDRFTGTPNLGFGFSDGARDYRIGWRLTSAAGGDPGFEVNLDAMRRESANDNGADVSVDHGVMLRAAIRW